MLLAGPPGLGKTSLAQIVAAEMDAPFVQTAGPALERKADIAAFLTALEPRSVFFVDEIHRLPRAVEETFYPAMEDRQLPITVGQGAGARVVTLDLPPFTLVGATTRAGLLTTPLRDRFGIQHRLEHYDAADLARIVMRSARVLGVEIDAGRRAGDRRARARHAARGQPPAQARARLRRGARRRAVDADGGRRRARPARGRRRRASTGSTARSSRAICEKFSRRPRRPVHARRRGGEEADTIEDVYEPYLLQRACSSARRAAACATGRVPAHRARAPGRPPRRCSDRGLSAPPLR